MKQKYVLTREDETLVIKEYAELEPGIYSLLCEESFASEKVVAIAPAGSEELVALLRTHNMYPPAIFATPIAEAVAAMFDGGADRRELLFDDADFISNERDRSSSFDADEEEGGIDDLLDEEESDDESFDEDDLENIDGGTEAPVIKISDDEGGVES